MSFEDDLDTDLEPDFKDVDVLVNKKLHTFRFTQMSGIDWGSLVVYFPVRVGSELDQQYGYNIDGLCMEAAKRTGVRLEDGEPVEMAAESWAKLWPKLSGHDFISIKDTIWGLNEFWPGAAVDKAKKASRRKSRVKPD